MCVKPNQLPSESNYFKPFIIKISAMKKTILTLLLIVFSTLSFAQTKTKYKISFENAVHHEAKIEVTFENLSAGPLEVRMSRTSPGRYAIHNFAKNVYGVKATDSMGNPLEVTRPNPQQWDVSGHDGTVIFEYILFADRADGTYSQVDETHAHLNIPATFVYPRNYMHRPVEVTFDLREDLNWKVATQLKREDVDTYSAPDVYYFMDSPIEIADYHLREEMVDGQLIRMALHTPANDNEVNEYFSKLIDIVKAQRDIYGELADYDYDEYTFLLCYMPQASGDGMEHRNSTVISGSKPLEEPLGESRLGTVSHEFFHSWNVERIRPAALEPFDFEEANMSGELWFAEGFTSYYTGLAMVRAGVMDATDYVEGLDGAINYVYNSPGLQFFNPIEMSYRAPFVDAATSIDPTNNGNIFVSYYSYGSVLGLALDLSLRSLNNDLNLDDFFKLVWETYGKTEISYSVKDLESLLELYAGKAFADEFFGEYIYNTNMPDYASLFRSVGVNFGQENAQQAWLGSGIREMDGKFVIRGNTRMGTPLYEAGLESGDEIISIAGKMLKSGDSIDDILSNRKPGQSVSVIYRRYGEEKNARITLGSNPNYKVELLGNENRNMRSRREAWLKGE